MNQQQAYEEQLIGAWILGLNLEYIPQIERFDYQQHIFASLKGQYNQSKCVDVFITAKETKTPTHTLLTMASGYMSHMFEISYRAVKEGEIKKMLLEASKNPKSIEKEFPKIVSAIEGLRITEDEQPSSLFEEYMAELNKRAVEIPMKYGIPRIDYITGGIRRQELTVIAARPSVGKSALALQIATNVAKTKKVAFYSLEMAKPQIAERLICRYSDINHSKLKNVKSMEDADWKMLGRAGDFIPANLMVFDRTSSLNGIRRSIAKYKPDAAVIDYIGLMKTDRHFNSKREEICYITNTLKAMTREDGTPIIALSQLNRNAQNKTPTLAELKESGSIEEDADNIIFIHRPSVEDTEKIDCFRGRYQTLIRDGKTPMVLQLEKHRNGDTGVTYAAYEGSRFIFREVEQ